MELKYRPEIDGLRALAVLPVIFFHAGASWIPGGFLGVDVFFVISGFLITSILMRESISGKFSFSVFYERRIRRIAPALIAMVSVTSVVSVFIMVPYDLKNFGQSVVATIFSANNILLYMTSGYWSTASEFKPLYHTWSLAVEEQYYLIAPVVVFLISLWKKERFVRNTAIILSAISIASFIFSLIFTSRNHEFSFLMLPSRAWEIALGGVAAIVHFRRSRGNDFFAFIGIALIVIGYVLLRGRQSHPGIETLVPVVGTCLYLIYSNCESGVGRLMSCRALVFCGAISYSLYLWHQPVFAFIRLSSQYVPSGSAFILSIPLIFLISYASYSFIEKPFRNRSILSTKVVVSGVICASLLLSAIGVLSHKTYGFQFLRPELAYGGNPQDYVDAPKRFKNIEFSQKGRKILFVGNSYARDIINVVSTRLDVNSMNIVYFEGNCYESINNKNSLYHYTSMADVIIYSDNWGGEAYNSSIDKLQKCYDKIRISSRANIFMPGTKNFGYNNNYTVNLSENERINAKSKPLNKYKEFNNIAKVTIGPSYIDILGMLEDSNGMVRVFDDDGRFLSYDTNHLTKYGAEYLGGILSTKSDLIESIR